MAQSVCLVVSAGNRARLEAIVADRNRSQKHAARARLVLLSADRLDVAAIACQAGISRPAVWRWQQGGQGSVQAQGRAGQAELRADPRPGRAGCAEPGCGGGTSCRSATSCTWPATTSG